MTQITEGVFFAVVEMHVHLVKPQISKLFYWDSVCAI